MAAPHARINRSVETDCPEAYSTCANLIEVRHEEDALVWFWAFPTLFPWPEPVTWLYTPVCGNARWPGDLWGVDARGNLLVVECKQCRRQDDPFKDFVAYHRDGREELSARHWRSNFRKHLAAELARDNATVPPTPGRTGGILPRSNHRNHIRRWPQLAQLIDARIREDAYRTTALSYLEAREALDDPRPVYVGLVILSGARQRPLTDAGLRSGKALSRIVGPESVQLVTTFAQVTSAGRLWLHAEISNLTEAVQGLATSYGAPGEPPRVEGYDVTGAA